MTTDHDAGSGSPAPKASWLHSLTRVTTWLGLLTLAMLLGGTVWIWIYAFSTLGSHWSYIGVGMLTAMAALLTGFLAYGTRSMSAALASASSRDSDFRSMARKLRKSRTSRL